MRNLFANSSPLNGELQRYLPLHLAKLFLPKMQRNPEETDDDFCQRAKEELYKRGAFERQGEQTRIEVQHIFSHPAIKIAHSEDPKREPQKFVKGVKRSLERKKGTRLRFKKDTNSFPIEIIRLGSE